MGFEPLREVEGIPFLKNNSVAVPGKGIASFQSQGGKKQPTIEPNYLQHPGVGKPGTETDVLDTFVDNAYNS